MSTENEDIIDQNDQSTPTDKPDGFFGTPLPEIEHGGETIRLGCRLPSDPPRVLAKLTAAQFRVWSRSEIMDAIKRKPFKKRTVFKGKTWILNQKQRGSCFKPGTLIRMADGTERPIEKVQLHDYVVTAEGHARQVLKVMVRPSVEPMFVANIQHRDMKGVAQTGFGSTSEMLQATAEHPILTARGYVPISELVKGDTLARPKFTIGSTTQKADSYAWPTVAEITKRQYAGYVYNLEVEDDHSYIADGTGVHNCNANAATNGLRKTRWLRGIDQGNAIQLCWEFLYAQINGGQDNGSTLEDGMIALQNIGVCPLDTAKHPINRDITKSRYDAADYAAAKLYQARQCFTVDTEEALATLILSEMGAATVAVDVDNSFMKLDSAGICGSGSGMGNHSVDVDDVEIINGELAFDMANSWDVTWGDEGRAYLTWAKHFTRTHKYHGFYGILGTNDGGNAAGPDAIE